MAAKLNSVDQTTDHPSKQRFPILHLQEYLFRLFGLIWLERARHDETNQFSSMALNKQIQFI